VARLAERKGAEEKYSLEGRPTCMKGEIVLNPQEYYGQRFEN